MPTKTKKSSSILLEIVEPGDYEIRRNPETGIIDCSCPGWRFIKLPIEQRVCKHMRLLGYTQPGRP